MTEHTKPQTGEAFTQTVQEQGEQIEPTVITREVASSLTDDIIELRDTGASAEEVNQRISDHLVALGQPPLAEGEVRRTMRVIDRNGETVDNEVVVDADDFMTFVVEGGLQFPEADGAVEQELSSGRIADRLGVLAASVAMQEQGLIESDTFESSEDALKARLGEAPAQESAPEAEVTPEVADDVSEQQAEKVKPLFDTFSTFVEHADGVLQELARTSHPGDFQYHMEQLKRGMYDVEASQPASSITEKALVSHMNNIAHAMDDFRYNMRRIEAVAQEQGVGSSDYRTVVSSVGHVLSAMDDLRRRF